jgi:hypothetical protein
VRASVGLPGLPQEIFPASTRWKQVRFLAQVSDTVQQALFEGLGRFETTALSGHAFLLAWMQAGAQSVSQPLTPTESQLGQ